MTHSLDVITVRTGRYRSIGAMLADAVTQRVQPDDPVTWITGYVVDRPGLYGFRFLLVVGRDYGLEITDDGDQGLWIRRGRLSVRGGWREVSRFARVWQVLTGQR